MTDNRITEKYFTQDDFGKRADAVLETVVSETGFVVERELTRGFLYDRSKVGSILYRGTWQGKSAVLKLQGLRPELDEGEIFRRFGAQNQSRTIRVPLTFAHRAWDKALGYGYLITELVEGPKLFEMPNASPEQMKEFARFYQEYRTSALTAPWSKPEFMDSLAFTLQRVDHWRKICETKERLRSYEYVPYLLRFYPLAAPHLARLPMVFGHGHLSANDIYRAPDGGYVVLSNLFWSYRPQWYDLAFNLWACLLHCTDPELTEEEFLAYRERWLNVYRTIPIVRADPDFERKFAVLTLERTIGAILADLGAGDGFGDSNRVVELRRLLRFHYALFDQVAVELEAHSSREVS